MAKSIMIQGTMSNVGKSILTAGLLRIFKQDGYKAAPFKAQNIALNSFIDSDGGEMGRAQAVQAQAAGIEPKAYMNPILIKPMGSAGSQIIVNGRAAGQMLTKDYYERKYDFLPEVDKAYSLLKKNYDIIVIEGAGSPAEINIKDHDIANMRMAKLAAAPVLLAGDIDRGGVFAALAGTLLLLDEDEKNHVKGLIINKFRGALNSLQPGLDQLESMTNLPVLGVVPYAKFDLEDEDSLSERLETKIRDSKIDIAVMRLPHISNFTDFNALSVIGGVSVRYVSDTREFACPDLVVIPGTKNTMGGLKWLRECGLEQIIQRYAADGGAVLGIGGGYQMLGKAVCDPLGMEEGGCLRGMELLPVETVFEPQNTQARTQAKVLPIGGILAQMSGIDLFGYEIRMGRTTLEIGGEPLLVKSDGQNDGCRCANVYGTYLHGMFDSPEAALTLVKALYTNKGLDTGNIEVFDPDTYRESQFDELARVLRGSLDMEKIYEILNRGV